MAQQGIENRKKVTIDFLYLDLSTCERCMETETNLDDVVQELSAPCKTLGLEIVVNKVNVISQELAIKYKFESSPTIRVNGIDILGEVKENICEACCEISGNETWCRTFEHEGVTYNDPSKAMIMNGIFAVIYGNSPVEDLLVETSKEYVMPENIKAFYEGVEKSSSSCGCGGGSCC